MAANTMARTRSQHPAPHRERVSGLAIAFGLFAGPAAWSLQILLNYGLASYVCFPARTPREAVPPGLDWVWGVLLAVNLGALGIATASAAVAFVSWRKTRGEAEGGPWTLIEAGEGRTRFLAVWGLLIGVGFLAAIAFDTLAIFLVPLCGG